MMNLNNKQAYPFCLFLLFYFLLPAQQDPIKVTFHAADGLLITADHYKTDDPSAPTIILFHQSVSSRGEYFTIAPRLQKAGFHALAVDLRWGRRDFWNKIVNETAARYGIDPILKAIEEEDKKELIWPTIFDAYQDMEAALDWVKTNSDDSSILIWGSSFSAMLQFKLAKEHAGDIDGMISFSPAEYYPQDTMLLSKWAREVNMPIYISCGKSEEERISGEALIKVLPGQKKQIFQSKIGRHGSSILFTDGENWMDLLPFLWSFIHPDRYLEKATQVGHWLDDKKEGGNQMIFWPDEVGSDAVSSSYSSGMSGKVVFLLDLWEATRDSSWLKNAILAGNYLLNKLPGLVDHNVNKGGAFSYYGNICGTGLAMKALFDHTKDEKYRSGLEQVCTILQSQVRHSEKGVFWDTHNDVLTGLAGTTLFLLKAHQTLGDGPLLELAEKAGEELLSRAINEKNGLNWYWAQDRPFVLPNFSHGTAGIAYTLARLYEETEKQHFLEGAEKAYQYLLSVAYQDGEILLIPYGVPNEGWDRPYDLGWAHGGAGSGRFFSKMHELTEEEKYLDNLVMTANGIVQSGWPGNLDSLFGKAPIPIDQRFGLAGIAEFLLDCAKITGNVTYADWARRMTDEVLSQAIKEGDGIYWSIPAYGFMGEKGSPKLFTGYFYGAAGYGSLLLELYRNTRSDE